MTVPFVDTDVIVRLLSGDDPANMIAAAMWETETSELYSYDRHFDRLPGITRLEP